MALAYAGTSATGASTSSDWKGANCVYKSSRRGLTEYRCGTCDFLVCLDGKIGRYFMGPGTTRRTVPTMHALAVFGPEESGPRSKR